MPNRVDVRKMGSRSSISDTSNPFTRGLEHPLVSASRSATSSGSGPHCRNHRRDNKSQEEDYEQHRPEQESENEKKNDDDLGLATQSRHQRLGRRPHRTFTRQDGAKCFESRYDPRVAMCGGVDESVPIFPDSLLNLLRQSVAAIPRRVQKPVNRVLQPLDNRVGERAVFRPS